MKQIDFNNYKPCFITRFGYKIDAALAIYRYGGIKETILFTYRMTKIKLFSFMYKHCKWYRRKIQSRFTADKLWMFLIFDMFMQKKTFDIKEVLKVMPEEEKERWKEQAIKSINEQIEKFNITDEEQIAKMYEMFGLEYHSVKPRPGFDD